MTTASASIGQAVSDYHLGNMPSIGRAPMAMAKLAFGVVDLTNPQANSRPFDNAGTSSYSLGGGMGSGNELLLDGAPNMTQNRRVSFNPPLDSVEEVKVEAFQADAAYGDTSGGTVSLVTKGGTNRFHGTVGEFNQVSKLAASPFFTSLGGNRKPVTQFNQYGFTAGSPIYIPRVYNGTNKAFWYLAYEGIKHTVPQPIITTVPTAAMRNGDFSSLLSLGGIYQLYDPLTGVAQGTRIMRQPFAGNVIQIGRASCRERV